jgi:hypothetical protein
MIAAAIVDEALRYLYVLSNAGTIPLLSIGVVVATLVGGVRRARA